MAQVLTEKFTVYLTETERKKLRKLSRDHGYSENALIRLAVRYMTDLPVPHGVDTVLHRVAPVDRTTSLR